MFVPFLTNTSLKNASICTDFSYFLPKKKKRMSPLKYNLKKKQSFECSGSIGVILSTDLIGFVSEINLVSAASSRFGQFNQSFSLAMKLTMCFS